MAADAEAPPSTRGERIGWYFYDWANSAFSTTVVTVFLGPYLGSIADNAADANGRVHPFGVPVAAGSLFAYTVSLSVVLQVLVLPVVGAIADRSPHKKQQLALTAYIGAGATTALVFLTGDRYLLGALLFLVANIAFGASVVVYNSFLPQIAGPDDRDRVSSIGWAVGYIGGGLLLALNVAAVSGAEAFGVSSGEIARWSIVSAGVWWAAFTTIPLRQLHDRPAVAGAASGSALLDGFRQLGRTLRELKGFPLTLLFLIAYVIYNDGIQTVIALASVYADKELRLPQSVQVQTILLVQLLAFFGALLLGWIARRFGPWKTVLGSLVVWAVVLAVAYTLPAGQPIPFVLLGALIGLVLGGSQALSRSLFSQLIPQGSEAQYFGIYEISDKGTSWLGPLLFGVTFQVTGSYRTAIISLIAFFVIGFVALAALPLRNAILAAGNTPPRVL
ncbi:MFS transporter [Actinomycetospora lutea]|uniref:MFS transporter n=1 Tax=Actinomycetospora lutea TaxID=663604 RepID=UPI00236524CE|nr:MFS transporter [Actinomycetospora lutea]MDD7937231.1 MFS transporter [Actinomycetospora lutea]